MLTHDIRRDSKERLQHWKEQYLLLNACPAREVLDCISDKWSAIILIALSVRPYRFGELAREIPEISQRVLTHNLRSLERDGLINRRVFPTKPPSVEYSLTLLGQSILVPILNIFDWADENRDKILKARKKFMRDNK